MLMANYRAQLLTPISKENSVGNRLLDDPQLDYIDAQMMKVGSLSHAQVQWKEVESQTLNLLATKTKDIKLLTVLLQCLQHQASAERFTLSIAVWVDFMTHFWLECQPVPGERGTVQRKRYFTQICQRTFMAAEKLDDTQLTAELKATLDTLLIELDEQTRRFHLPIERICDLSARIQRKLAKVSVSSEAVTTHNERQPVTISHISSTQSSILSRTESTLTDAKSAVANVDIDSSNDRVFKTSLLNLVEHLSMFNQDGSALSIRIRRFATWFSITGLPDASSEGETQLMPVSSDRVRDYEEQLKREVDIVLWHRVEESLTKSPYWLDGHYLSYRIALVLNEKQWADIIKDELQYFIQRLPQLKTYSFKGKVPFMSAETLAWLGEPASAPIDHSVKPTVVTCHLGSWEETRQEAQSLVQEKGLSQSLAMLNDGLAKATQPRDVCYWRLLSADIMKENALSAMALHEYQNLKNQMKDMSAMEWEPSFMAHIENNIAE